MLHTVLANHIIVGIVCDAADVCSVRLLAMLYFFVIRSFFSFLSQSEYFTDV